MNDYIGAKAIKAEPAYRIDGHIYTMDMPVPRSMNREEGYKVVYPDGYESWSPKEVFEKAYLPLTVNPGLKTDKPSISQEMVDNFIEDVKVTTMGGQDHCGSGHPAEWLHYRRGVRLRFRRELRRDDGR